MTVAIAPAPVAPSLAPKTTGYTSVMWGSTPGTQHAVTIGYDPTTQTQIIDSDVTVRRSQGGTVHLDGVAPTSHRLVTQKAQRLQQALEGVDLLALESVARRDEPASGAWMGFATSDSPDATPHIVSISDANLPPELNAQLTAVRRAAYLVAQAVDRAA